MGTSTGSIYVRSNVGTLQKPVASRTELLLNGPILPTLLRLAAPNVLNLLAIVAMITFDAIFIGRLGADALAGVSLVFPWVMFMQHAAASGMGGGVSSAIARALGASQRERANALATHALVLAVALSGIATTVMLALGPSIYRAMGGGGPALSAALAYSNVVFSGIVAVWMLNIVANVVRGTGNMALPALVMVGAVAAHVLLSSALIFGWGVLPMLGAAGAGWGLIVSFTLGTLVLLNHLRRPDSLVKLEVRRAAFQWTLFAEILKVGVPGMLNVAITNLSVVVLTAIAARLGQSTAIGYAMGARLEYILIPLAFGFGTAIVAMVGTNWGAKQFERARRIAWTGGITIAVACGSIGIFAGLFGQVWMGLFTDDAALMRIGASYLAIAGPAYGFYGLGMGLYFATQGCGRVLPAVVANGARFAFSAGAGAAAVFWLDAGPVAFFAAIAAGFVLYAALTVRAALAVNAPAFTIAALVFACAATYSAAAVEKRSDTGDKAPHSELLTRYQPADRDIVRMRPDVRRQRLWVLTPDSVYIYDTAARTLLYRIQLPAWSMADVEYALPPDLVLDDRGVAYLSSNVEPRLLEIEPATFQVKEHHLRLMPRAEAETGFGALRFAPDGALLAVSTTARSRFRIDLQTGSAREMP